MDVAPDDDELAQWMALCDDCDNPVEYYCNTCGDRLCISCKQQHLSRRKNKNHEVVPYTADIHISKSLTATCDDHQGRQVELYCKPCQIPVCSQCVAETHSNHKLTSLTEAISRVREQATSVLQHMLTEDRPRLREEKTLARNITESTVQALNETKGKMRQNAELLHKAIDALFETDLSRLREVEDSEIQPRAKELEDKANENLDTIESITKEYEDILQSINPVDLLNFMKLKSRSIQKEFPPTEYQDIPLPEFKPGTIRTSVLRDQFGSLDIESVMEEHRKSADEERSEYPSKSGGFTDERYLKPIEGKTQKTQKELVLGKPRLRSNFTIESKEISNLYRLRFNKENKIWIHDYGRRLLLTDRKGRVLENVDAGCKITLYTGMAVTEENELIYCDNVGKKVMKMTESGVITTFLATKPLMPFDIYCLSNGNFIVTFAAEGLLKIYTYNGVFIRNVGKGNLAWPYYVTVNKLNQDICVSDNREQVVVFSSEGHHRFTYKGDDEEKSGFRPFDLCTDHIGDILITDRDYHRVHIVENDGQLLQYLATKADCLQYPITIEVDKNGYVWIGEQFTKKVKAYKYLL